MAPYYPLYVRRSDGKLEIKSGQGLKEKNEPTAEQLSTKPNAQGVSDFYRECKYGDAKEIDWRRKLGGMLIRELGSDEHKDKNYILAALPENYRVYEHVKCNFSELESGMLKPTKNHAAGSNERQDAYLYGHPGGKRKRFRSPAEFFPHLLWLATDLSGDPGNCSCRICTPEEIEDFKPAAKARAVAGAAKTDQQKPASKSTNESAPQKAPQPSKTPEGVLQTPNALPAARSAEQRVDLAANKLIYRTGELVFFARSSAWGLGCIVNRANDQIQYKVQPLSYPGRYLPEVDVSTSELRPWLGWSPPPYTRPELNPSENNGQHQPTFESVDWAGLLSGQYARHEAEVDASILAARMLETTFTPIGPIPAPSAGASLQETQYSGIYIGAEKIWVGDPLRLRKFSFPTDIMVLQSITEYHTTADRAQPRLVLSGDTYCYRIKQLEPHGIPKDTTHLPPRLREDLDVRNNTTMSRADPLKRFESYWRLSAKNVQLGIGDIKGRWYESAQLMPYLHPEAFAKRHTTGEIEDIGLYMNGQGDCNGPLRNTSPSNTAANQPERTKAADRKVSKREEAFGRSVPVNFQIRRSSDEGETFNSSNRQPRAPKGQLPGGRPSSATAGSKTQAAATPPPVLKQKSDINPVQVSKQPSRPTSQQQPYVQPLSQASLQKQPPPLPSTVALPVQQQQQQQHQPRESNLFAMDTLSNPAYDPSLMSQTGEDPMDRYMDFGHDSMPDLKPEAETKSEGIAAESQPALRGTMEPSQAMDMFGEPGSLRNIDDEHEGDSEMKEPSFGHEGY